MKPEDIGIVFLFTILFLIGFAVWFLVAAGFAWVIALSLGFEFMWRYAFALMALQTWISPISSKDSKKVKKMMKEMSEMSEKIKK